MSDISKEELLRRVAPCSLLCYTCPGCKDGAIACLSAQLCAYYEGYYAFNDANLPAKYRGWLEEFSRFYDMLTQNAQAACPTCRQQPEDSRSCIPGCVVRACHAKKGVDFCADCEEFPCAAAKDFFAGVNPAAGEDWIPGSNRIRQIGAQAYYRERESLSHYQSYKKDDAQ